MKRKAAAPELGPLGFSRCACSQWAIVLVQTVPVCGACLPDALARARREAEELRRRLADLGHPHRD